MFYHLHFDELTDYFDYFGSLLCIYQHILTTWSKNCYPLPWRIAAVSSGGRFAGSSKILRTTNTNSELMVSSVSFSTNNDHSCSWNIIYVVKNNRWSSNLTKSSFLVFICVVNKLIYIDNYWISDLQKNDTVKILIIFADNK